MGGFDVSGVHSQYKLVKFRNTAVNEDMEASKYHPTKNMVRIVCRKSCVFARKNWPIKCTD
jgi:hypothetical protein